ncbi:MAG: hypothetical protein H7308_04945 [Chthonomonadaceae bacterium]|nr:hypothetical protein [Chthonomonadaceae bacterium]
MSITLTPETEAMLYERAEQTGEDPNALAEVMLRQRLEWDRKDYEEAVNGIRKGFEDSDAGRVKSAQEVHARLRASLEKHRVEQSVPA